MAEYIGSVKKDDTDMLETTFVQDGDIRQMVVAPKGTSVEELKKLARKQKLAPLYSPEYTKALNTALARRRDPLPEPRPINFRDWRPKKEEETNPIVTFGKSAINQVSELTVGTASMLYAYGNEAGAQLAQDLHGEELSDEAREKWRKEIEEIGRKGWEKSRAVKDMFQFDNTPGESETAQNAGSLITPYLLMGLGYLATGGVAPLVALYGTSSGLGTIENARLKGDTPKRALMRGVASGFAEAGLERVGANVMISSITNKRLYPLMNRFVFPAWGGVVQEGLQTAKDMAINYDLEPVTADEALDQILTASMWGAFGELAGTQIGYMRNREMIRRSVEEKALAAGHDAKTAKKISRAATPSVNELAGDITETLRENNEQLEKFTFEQMEEYEKSLELTRNLPTEDAAAEVQFYDGLKNVILEGGIEENEARRQAAYWSLMVKNDYELAKESGTYQGNMAEFQRDWLNLNVANRKNTRAVKTGNRVVETPVRMSEDEISEAWAARQQERQMSDEEREFFAERPSRKLFSLGDRQTDFTEFRGNPEGAIEKLLQEKNGYVSGAVYKEGIGDIDFIYGQPGKNGYGLAHIIERRNQQGINGEEFVREIPELIKSGNVYTQLNYPGRKYIVSGDKEAAVRLDWNGENRNWLVTAYMKKNKGALVGFRTYDQTHVDKQSFPLSNSFDTGRALPALRTSSGQIYLDEPITSSNPASENNISSDTENVNNKLFSTGETVRGTYDPSERLIELFADAKPDTLTHELSHHFFQNHFRVAQEYGFSDYDRGVMKWLSKRGKHDITGFADMQDQDWENLTEAFIRYLNTDTAPTIATRGLFQKAKEWVLGVYDINRDYASNEVKDFFDALVSREGEIPNIDNIIQNKADFEEAAKRALRGEGATFRGQSIKDIRALRKAINTRVRRPGKTLAQELRALGYRIDNVNRTLVDEKGVVEDARLAEILQELGVLDNVATETYEQTEALSSKMQEILSNADTTYSPREARIRQERETSVANQAKAQQFIDELLKDNQLGIKTIEELDEMLARILSKPDNTDIVKVNRDAIKYLQAKNAEMNKNYREAIRQVKQAEKVRRETQYQLQNRIKDFIRGLPVTGDHKAALMGNIQRVKDADSFEKVLADVRTRAAGYIEQEQKQLNRNIINDILRRSKPKERKKQNFNYEHNKLFEELREYNKLTQEQAKEKLQAIYETLDEEISPAEMIKRRFIQYKATGLKSSSDVLEALARDLSSLYNDAINEKLDTLEKKGKERNAKIESLLNYIKGTKKVNKADQLLLKFTNLESNMAELFGKEWAEQHEMETVLLHQEIEQSKKINSALDEAKSIYGVEKKSDFTKLMAEKSQENDDWVLYGINGAAEGSQEKMSTMKLVDLYLGAKNPRTREQLNYLYEQFDREGNQITTQIDDMLGYLDEKDKAFGDMLQRRVNERYEAENKIYVKLYGIDMPKQESYWMRSSHKSERELMDVKKFMDIDALPGFMKERAKTPFIYPENAWKKFASRMVDSVYMTEVFEKYKDIYDIVHSNRIKNAIINKYDDKRYESLNQSLKEISLGGVSKNYNEIENIINKAISNWVVSKISISDSVFVKQLASFTNYAENMPVLEFVQGVGEFLVNPAKAIKFMREFDGEFLDYRLSSGMQNEVLSKIISDSGKGYSRYSNLYQAYLEKITIPVRYGDVGAIYLGGYARVKNLLKEGKSLEEARKIFEHETLRAQQSGNPASTATFQKNPIFRLFTAFKNTQLQYLRKLQDSAIQYRRGEISGAQLGKIWGNYMFIQSILYQLLTNLWGYLWNDDDEELKLWEDVWMRVFISPIGGLPVLGDVAEGMLGERFYGLNIPARQDIERFITAFRSVMDGEIDAKKIGKGMLGVTELGMPLPDKVLRKLMDYLLDD